MRLLKIPLSSSAWNGARLVAAAAAFHVIIAISLFVAYENRANCN